MKKYMYELEKRALDIRLDIIEMSYKGAGLAIHVGPSMSSADILAALYFHILDVRPEEPHWEDRDRFIISKGHACPVVYAALAERGFFPKEELLTVRGLGSRLQGHPDMTKTPGIDMTSGSLGNGISCGLGIAMALNLQQKHSKVYVLLGDGETQEGLVWEAAMAAPCKKADNLVAIIDNNHYQSCGHTPDIMNLEPLADKWKAFGWKVMEMNGHDMQDVVSTLEKAKRFRGAPVCIIASTTKGKGVSFIENNNKWHAKVPTDEEYSAAIKELELAKENLIKEMSK